MDNNFSESKRNLSRAPQETELGSVPVNQWHSPYKKQVRNLEFQLTSVSRGRVRPPLVHRCMAYAYTIYIHKLRNVEIPEKKKRVKHLRRRNIEISEKKKHVEDLGHDVRHGYKYIYIYIYGASVSEVADSTEPGRSLY